MRRKNHGRQAVETTSTQEGRPIDEPVRRQPLGLHPSDTIRQYSQPTLCERAKPGLRTAFHRPQHASIQNPSALRPHPIYFTL